MKYMGSKNRLSKEIIPILNSFKNRNLYIEPFVGGANIIDKIPFNIRKGYDKNPYLISLLDYVSRGGLLPETISEKEYYNVRDNKNDHPNWYVGLVGFCASFGGRFFEGYPRGNKSDGTPRDYTNEAIRNIEKQRDNIRGIIFDCCDYSELDLREIKCLVYCDPPYFNSKPYKENLLGSFSHFDFWEWVSDQSEYNPVIVSEYDAPDDFICIWEKQMKVNLKQDKSKISTEKLFIDNKWINEYNLDFYFDKKQLKII